MRLKKSLPLVFLLAMGFMAQPHTQAAAVKVTEAEINENNLRALSDKAAKATVKLSSDKLVRPMSGVMITGSGYILTVKSTLNRGDQVSVNRANGDVHEGKVVATYPYHSMALIKTDTTKADHLPLGDSTTVKQGDQVVSAGNAFYASNGRATPVGVTYGIISSRCKIKANKVFYDGDVFTTDARINRGQEGGALLDMAGHLIAINGEGVLSTQTNAYVSIALPIEKIKIDLLKRLKNDLSSSLGPLTLVGLTMDGQTLKTGGIKISQVSAYARKGGVLPGDLLLKVGGTDIDDRNSLEKALFKVSPERLIPAYIYRKGEVLKRYVVMKKGLPIDTMLLSEAYREAVNKVAPSVVRIFVTKGEEVQQINRFKLGSGPFTGLVYRRDGYILTSSFIIPAGYQKIEVELKNGKRYQAKVLGRDTGRNITLLRIKHDDLPVPRFVSKESVDVGASILSLGRTFTGKLPEISRGMVSALNRSAGKAVQIDSNLTPANFGGPTIDLEGRVIGINIPQANLGSGIRGGTAGGEMSGSGIGFVIPISDIDLLFKDLKKGKVLEPAFLGIRFDYESDEVGSKIDTIIQNVYLMRKDLNAQQKKRYDQLYRQYMTLGLSQEQADEFRKLNKKTVTGAWQAGLRPGDVIVEFNSHKIASYNVLMNVIGSLNSGEKAVFKIKRFGAIKEVSDVLGQRGLTFR